MRVNLLRSIISICVLCLAAGLQGRETYNFNAGWLMHIGERNSLDYQESTVDFPDSSWQSVTLPRAHNEDEAFRLSIEQLTDTVAWYRKHFKLPAGDYGKVFVEFEGIRQSADFFINGHKLGNHENGVMAVAWDITPYLNDGENVMAVRVDNDWNYVSVENGLPFQWNNQNFNANYGGIVKNVLLHVCPDVYQTLPLWSSLASTGTYIYASEIDIPSRSAVINVATEVANSGKNDVTLSCNVSLTAPDGVVVATFKGEPAVVKAGQKSTLTASDKVNNLEFWSWGYGYLYNVCTWLSDENGIESDKVITRTGFRKTQFEAGKIWLNDRVIQMHGYAQRTSNEWPALGIDVPAWLSDYSNGLMVESGGNVVRWMHVTPSKQDVMSCDRVGLIQAMPAGDAEKDVEGGQWEHRLSLMRDAIIYNRNNPSILFYECGNKGITPAHMAQMKAIRDTYDPHGGRAIGCREMLGDDHCAEYGGEMLYINRSARHPVWAMEYCRDEGMRKNQDDYSWPFHKEGDGPLYRGKDASDYNHNQDMFAVELVKRWYDYYRERPGSGSRCSSGGAKIIFSDTNTHYRGAENYRRSGVTDAMRIPKEAFYAHQVMWAGAWVDCDTSITHIVGHWNYPDSTVKPVYVISAAPVVEMYLNGRRLDSPRREYEFLHTLDSVAWEPGELLAVSKDADGNELSRHSITTAGQPASLMLTVIEGPEGLKADGADVALIQVEVVDSVGKRCPVDNSMIHFSLEGPAEWRGGIAQGPGNYILSKDLPVECGVNRVLIRSATLPGSIRLTAHADGLDSAAVEVMSQAEPVNDGLNDYLPAFTLPCRLTMGATPAGASYKERKRSIKIINVEAGSHHEDAAKSFDDNEETMWVSNDGIDSAWIKYNFENPSIIDDICLKLQGWRSRSYPVTIEVDGVTVWSGYTPKSLGYVHITPVMSEPARSITIRLSEEAKDGDAYSIGELGGGVANEKEKSRGSAKRIGIVEAEFLQNVL